MGTGQIVPLISAPANEGEGGSSGSLARLYPLNNALFVQHNAHPVLSYPTLPSPSDCETGRHE